MRTLKILFLTLALSLSPLSFSQGGAGSSAAGSAGALSSGVIAAIAAAVLAVAAIVDAQDGEKVTLPQPIEAVKKKKKKLLKRKKKIQLLLVQQPTLAQVQAQALAQVLVQVLQLHHLLRQQPQLHSLFSNTKSLITQAFCIFSVSYRKL